MYKLYSSNVSNIVFVFFSHVLFHVHCRHDLLPRGLSSGREMTEIDKKN